jgi:hypothetical protein
VQTQIPEQTYLPVVLREQKAVRQLLYEPPA